MSAPRRRPAPRRTKRTTAERGYGIEHKRERERVGRIVAAGGARCARCGGFIVPGSRWHLDHTDDRRGYLGPSHAFCNVSAAQRRRNGLPVDRMAPPAAGPRPRALGFFDLDDGDDE